MQKIIILLLPLAIIGAVIFVNISKDKTAKAEILQPITVTAGDLALAGFSDAQTLSNTKGQFVAPPYYFSVSDRTSQSLSAPSIVMVSATTTDYDIRSLPYAYGAEKTNFNIIGGQGQEGTIADGRTAINFIKNRNYVVVIGPNKQKIEKLASLLSDKIPAQE